MKKLFFFLPLLLLAATSCQSQGSGESQENVLPPEAYETKLDALEEVQLLDVRTPREYEGGHIEGAVNINYFDDDFLRQAEQRFEKNQPVLLYCRSGNRSAKATEKMKAAGFKEIYDLEGGYKKWSKR